MKKKTILFNVLTLAVLVLTSYSAMTSDIVAAWFGLIASAVTLFLNTTYTSSGKWLGDEWNYAQWAVVIANMLLNVGALATSSALIPVDVVNFVTIAATICLQFFGKTFITETSDGHWK